MTSQLDQFQEQSCVSYLSIFAFALIFLSKKYMGRNEKIEIQDGRHVTAAMMVRLAKQVKMLFSCRDLKCYQIAVDSCNL